MTMRTLSRPLPLPGPSPAITDTWDVMVRNLRNALRTPQVLVFATIQPVIFVVLFRYVFGGAIRVPGTSYVDFLMPGIFVQSVAFGAMNTTGIGLATDLQTGLVQRFRTLPMSRMAVLAGRTCADLVRNLFVIGVMAAVGFAVGFRVHTDALHFLAAIALVALFAYTLSWAFVTLALRLRNPEAAQAAGVPLMFALVFSSSAFVPVDTMPGWLQAFAAHQPLSAFVDSVRDLVLGGAWRSDVLAALAWSVVLLVGFMAISIVEYRRMSR